MVLRNLLLIGLILSLAWTTTCTPESKEKPSPSPETTTTSVSTTTKQTQNVTTSTTQTVSTSQIVSTTTSKPKTDVTINKITEQIKSRGSTKYANFVHPTTEAATSTITKKNVQDRRGSVKHTTVRNDRSLNINTDKYNNAEFHSENNINAETQAVDTKKYISLDKEKMTTDKPWEHMNFDEQHTIELTTPKDDMFDNKFKKMHDDITRTLDSVDKFFEEKKTREEPDNIEKPQVNEKLDYIRFRNLEAKESKNKNKVHKDFTGENGMRLETSSSYNSSKVIDAPGIVVNTIPSKKDEAPKKTDLEQGETKLEKIKIEKPEKDPIFINNKIDGATTEGPEEKPLEHKGIYLSKRGSTVQNSEQPIERTSPSESEVPSDLLPLKTSPGGLENIRISLNSSESTTTAPKRKEKPTKTSKKDLDTAASDLDNKIPKFLPLDIPDDDKIENATANLETSSESATTEMFYEVEQSDMSTPTSFIELYTTETSENEETETTGKMNFYEATLESTTEFNEDTESVVTEETTVYTEPISGSLIINFSETTMKDQAFSEDGTTENSTDKTITEEKEEYTTIKFMEKKVSKSIDLNNTHPNSNASINLTNYNDILNLTNNSLTTKEMAQPSAMMAKVTESTFTADNFSTTEKITINTIQINTNDTKFTESNTKATIKKNESTANVVNEITKPPNLTTVTIPTYEPANGKGINAWEVTTEKAVHVAEDLPKENNTKIPENDQTKQNEISINGDKILVDECEHLEEGDDYVENNCKPHNGQENGPEIVLDEHTEHGHVVTQSEKLSTASEASSTSTADASLTTRSTTPKPVTVSTTISLPTTTANITSSNTPNASDGHRNRQMDLTEAESDTTARPASIVDSEEEEEEEEGGNGGKIAAIVISIIGGICLLLLVTLLIVMKKRQKRFNYGQRCRPVSLDAYSMDNVSIHNSTRRKGVLMMSKRSYGNPAFEDPSSPSHPLSYNDLIKFTNNQEAMNAEFDKIPQVTTRTNELPEGCDVKNRYANVIPLPETRVFLNSIDGAPSSDYINANYVTGPQGARHYYIASQAPMQSTIEDFWRMIWEQQSKVILMLTHLYENGVEKCVDYLPPSEVLDCHRLFGDYQITLKKREVKDKYIISSLQLKNMVSNSWREVTHLWYMGWPEKGVPDEANSLIAFLIEARSYVKTSDNKIKETNISNGLAQNTNPIIVHCSPGTGRTGTVIACDIAVREFELTRKVDIPRIVYKVRRDRASAVQTKEQYSYIYKVINFYATKLTGGVFDSF